MDIDSILSFRESGPQKRLQMEAQLTFTAAA